MATNFQRAIAAKRSPSALQKYVAEYIAALKSRDKAAVARAARWSKQICFSKEAWSAEMDRQAKGDAELQAFLADARAAIAANIAANQTYLENRPWSPHEECLRNMRATIITRFGNKAGSMI